MLTMAVHMGVGHGQGTEGISVPTSKLREQKAALKMFKYTGAGIFVAS